MPHSNPESATAGNKDRLSPCEVSWFSALCDDDYEFLGQPDPRLQSSWEHCRDIALAAETGGYDNLLLPSGYALGIDTTAFAAAVAPLLHRLRLLMAVRIGESWPPQLARQIATIDRLLGGRLTVNIISSDLPGETRPSGPRYRRTIEAMHILKTLLNGQPLDHQGEFWQFKLDPPRVTTVSGRAPLLYFGGLSEDAREAAAAGADVYLMWPDRMETVAEIVTDLRRRAAWRSRTLRFGYRVHVVVRETEAEARAAADRLLAASTPRKAKRSAPARSTPNRPGCAARPNCARRRATTAMSRTICGPASAAPARAAARRSSAIRIRSSPSSRPIAPLGSRRSSSRAIRTSPRPICSPGTSCHGSITARSKARRRAGPERRELNPPVPLFRRDSSRSRCSPGVRPFPQHQIRIGLQQ
jgi:alkanesulfonate monooxygenase